MEYKMNKKLIALLAASSVTSAMAGVELTGKYEGTISEGGSATYAQDLDLTLVGTVAGGSVTATMENLEGGDNITTNELFVETSIEGINFKGGKSKGKNGDGLLQKKSAATNKMALSTTLGGFGVGINQVSGDSNATVDVSSTVGGIDIAVQNMTNDSRFVTISTSVGGIDFAVERQKSGAGTNTGVVGTTVVAGVEFSGVYIDVEDTTGVTQNDGILGDISDANNNSTVAGGVVVLGTAFGEVTGKYIDKNDATTYVGKLKRGVMEYGYTKTENTDGLFEAVLTLEF
jgi:hypothetical protein